jgi:hypothetical protein
VTIAPSAFEVAFFMLCSDWCGALGVPKDQIIEDYREIAGDRCDARSIGLGIIAAFALCGIVLWQKPDALAWWTTAVQRELNRWSPLD